LLYEILNDDGNSAEAEKVLDDVYGRALKLITDRKGNWPDILGWGWLENRHIIRAIFNKAVSLWHHNEVGEALDLLRKLLKTNPMDNVGARDYILAIRMGMSFDEFEGRFNRGGYYDIELTEWFDKNYGRFPEEFGTWEKVVEQC